MPVKRQKGFGLIEILVACSILLILASMAGVALTQMTKAAQATNAVSTMSAIVKAERTYFETYGSYTDLATLGGPEPCVATPTNACLLSAAITTGAFTKNSYVFGAQGTQPYMDGNGNSHFFGYEVNATPTSGRKTFCADQTEQIRFQQSYSDPASPIGLGNGSCSQIATVSGVSGPIQ